MNEERSQEPLLTVKGVAILLNCSESHVRRLFRERKIPQPVRVGRAIRWSRKVLQRWIDDGCPVTEETNGKEEEEKEEDRNP